MTRYNNQILPKMSITNMSHRGLMAELRIERSGFEAWPGSLCCVLGRNNLISQCLSSSLNYIKFTLY